MRGGRTKSEPCESWNYVHIWYCMVKAITSWHYDFTKTNQGIEHQGVIGILFWGLHHDVEQGIKSVLEKLYIKQKPIIKVSLKKTLYSIYKV